MRVNIETVERTTGLLRKTTHYDVAYHVEFSEEEKQIIKQRNLQDFPVIEGRMYNVTIGMLLKGKRTVEVPDVMQAKLRSKEYEERFRMLKDYLAANAEKASKRTLEL